MSRNLNQSTLIGIMIVTIGLLISNVTNADDERTDEEIAHELLPQFEPFSNTVRIGPVTIGAGEKRCTWVPGYYKNHHWVLGHQDCRKFY